MVRPRDNNRKVSYMIKVEQNNTLYLFDCHLMRYVRSFGSKDDLLNFLARNFHIFSNINMNGKDSIKGVDFNGKEFASTRQYLFIDSDNRIIDIRHLMSEVIEKIIATRQESDLQSQRGRGDKLVSDLTGPYIYRIGPVPNLRKKTKIKHLRRMKTTSEIRENAAPEYRMFVRGSRNNIPTYYDDKPRTFSRSWKDQCKTKYQWDKPQK